MTNRQAFATALAVLGAAYDRPLTPEAIEAYWLALGDIPEQLFAQATHKALRESKFMPSPSELRELALGKDWKAKEDSRRLQEATNAKLRRLEAIPATAEEIAQSRREVRAILQGLTAGADVRQLAPDPAAVVVSLEEKAVALKRIEGQLRAQRNGAAK